MERDFSLTTPMQAAAVAAEKALLYKKL